jgi:hypothetical protein
VSMISASGHGFSLKTPATYRCNQKIAVIPTPVNSIYQALTQS